MKLPSFSLQTCSLRHAVGVGFSIIFSAMALANLSALAADPVPGLGAIPEISFNQLSDRNLAPLGQAALTIRPQDWKHAETQNFVYHYFQSFVATPVSVEAEFCYSVIAKELGKDTTQWERKAHIFVFEKPEDWAQFRKRGSLDPWTGGIHANNELFIQRNPEHKWKGITLGHEIAHLVVHRFFGPGVPLWLNEGYAEYAAERGYAAFYRARGYLARPRTRAIDPAMFIGLGPLTEAVTYPGDVPHVETFYNESERLVRFLSGVDKPGFARFFEALSQGNRLDSALSKGFGGRFNLDGLEREFKVYATKEFGNSVQK